MAKGFNVEALWEHAPADMREAALLWLVFSNLDAIIEGEYSLGFALGHSGGAIALWLLGSLLGTKPKRREDENQ